MNYAIEQLDKYPCNVFKDVIDFVENYKNGFKEKPKGIALEFLNELKFNLEEGLKSWGSNFQSEKKRQEKRLKDVNDILGK